MHCMSTSSRYSFCHCCMLIESSKTSNFQGIKYNKKSTTRRVQQEECNKRVQQEECNKKSATRRVQQEDDGFNHSRTPKKMVPNVIPKINSTGVGGMYIHLYALRPRSNKGSLFPAGSMARTSKRYGPALPHHQLGTWQVQQVKK